jgi:hypothetical protein
MGAITEFDNENAMSCAQGARADLIHIPGDKDFKATSTWLGANSRKARRARASLKRKQK